MKASSLRWKSRARSESAKSTARGTLSGGLTHGARDSIRQAYAPVVLSGQCRDAAGLRPAGLDYLARRRNHVPQAARAVEPLAVRDARGRVGDVGIERPAVVGDDAPATGVGVAPEQ